MDQTHPIKLWLNQKGMTQADFANLVGTTDSYLNQILNGWKHPSPRMAARMRDLTGIALDAILLWRRP